MTAVESSPNNNKLLQTFVKGVTVIGKDVSAGPFENAEEMKKEFEELKVDGYDEVGEKLDVVSN